jgi:hypothetical protein
MEKIELIREHCREKESLVFHFRSNVWGTKNIREKIINFR